MLTLLKPGLQRALRLSCCQTQLRLTAVPDVTQALMAAAEVHSP